MLYKYIKSPLGGRLKKERRVVNARMGIVAFSMLAISILVFAVAGVKPAERINQDEQPKIVGRVGR